jgi:hypothetical protein
MDEYVTLDLGQPLELVTPPSQMTFFAYKDKWFMKMTTEGIFFNHEEYPTSQASDFARAFMELMEKNYKIKFIEKD